MPGLHFDITADNQNFIQRLNEVTSGVRNASQMIEAEGGSIDRVLSNIKAGVATMGIGLGFKEIVSQVASTRGEFQQLEVAFKTMLGSAEEADALMNQLVQTAAKTPFDLQGIANGAKSLMAYGVGAEDVNETLVRLGDIAAGLSIPLNDLVYLYGTTMVQGRMFTQDLRQFQGRGVPIADELAKQFGVAKEKVGELVTAGKVGAKEFQAAIIAMTSEGSQFGGLMEAQSKTITGQISNIEDSIDTMFNEIGKSSEGIINLSLNATSKIVENWQSVALILGDIAAAYGAQKAALALEAGFSSAATNYGYDAEIAQLQALLPMKEADKKSSIEQAVADGKLSEAKAIQVETLRAEAEAYLETLAIKQAEAKQAEVTAQANLTTALQEQKIAKEMVEAAEKKWKIAYDSADAIAEEAAMQELETARAIESEAADAVATATKEAKAASSAHVAAQQATESATTAVNTAQTTGNTAATGILTIAKEKLALAIAKVNAVLKANQFAIVTGAIIALGYAIYKLITYQTDYEKGLDRLDKASLNCEKSISAESHEVDILFGKLNSAKKGTKEWEDAKNSIWSKYGKYLKALGDETTALNDVAKAYSLVRQEVLKAAKARAMDNFLKSEGDTFAEDMGNYVEKAYQLVKNKYGQKYADLHMDDIRDVVEGRAKVNSDFLKSFDEDKIGLMGVRYTGNDFKDNLNNAYKRQRDNASVLAEAERKFGTSGSEANESDSENTTKDRSYWEQEVKNRKEAYENLLKTDKEGSAKAKKAYDEAVAELNKYNSIDKKTKKSSSGGSRTSAKQTETRQKEAHQKLLDLMRQQAEERFKLQQEYEYTQWQNRIDLMEEGEEKVLAQMRLDQSKELTSLQEQKEQAVKAEIARQKAMFDAKEDEKAAGNKKYTKQVFNPGEDIANTVSNLVRLKSEIQSAQEELTRLTDSNADVADIDKIKSELKSLNGEHEKYMNKMGDVTQKEVSSIIKQYDNLYAQIKEKQSHSYDERIKSAQESLDKYLQMYGSYQQRIDAINREYDSKIQAASPAERPMIEKERDTQISAVRFDEFTETGLYAKAFGDISKLSASTVKELIADMKRYRREIYKTFDPSKIKEYEKALSDLESLDVDNMLGAFSSFVPDAIKDQIKQEKEYIALQEQKNALEERYRSIQNTIISQQGQLLLDAKNQGVDLSIDDLNSDTAFEDVANKFKEMGKEMSTEFSSNLSSMVGNMGQMGGIQSQMGQVGGAMAAMGGGMGGGAMNTMNSIGAVVHAVNDSVQSAKELFDDLMGTAETFGADTEVGSTWAQASLIMDGFSEASEGATKAFDSLKSGNPIGVIQGVVQSFTAWIKAFNKVHDAARERTILDLQEQIEDLQRAYDKLGKKVDDVFSTDASNLIEQQNAMLRQQQALMRQQMAEESSKKDSDDEKIKQWKEQLEDISDTIAENEKKAKEAIIGQDIKSAIGEFADAYASAWDDGTDAAEKSMSAVKSIITSALNELLNKRLQPTVQRFYDALAKAMEDGVLTDAELTYLDIIKAEMDAVAAKEDAQYKKIQERYKDLDELREELTDISFDSVSDNFKSLLSDMESSVADFSDSFTEMLRNAIVEGLMNEKYNALLKEWYEEFAKAMSDHTLSDEERERLRQQYQSIVDQGLQDRDTINDITGGDAYSQSASSGGWESMGQDTADELNGRFTALTELYATGNNLRAINNQIARDILATLQTMGITKQTESDSTLLAIRDMMFLSTGYLEDIAKYSKQLNSIDNRIATLNSLIDQRL